MKDVITELLNEVTSGRGLTRDQARLAFEHVMAGELSDAVIAELLAALSAKGECVDELVGAAEAMRAAMIRVSCDAECIDTCGTGGDGISTFNVSTTAAIIAAAAGATVAKHGNRSTTRASGSTEVLAQLGVDVDTVPGNVERSLREIRIGYLNARLFHPAMKQVAPVRQSMGVRTIFNLLGPLTNPAGARRQVVGVPGLDLMETVAMALDALGAEHVWVVHGNDGLCDVTVTATTEVWELRNGAHSRFTVTPEQVGLQSGSLGELRAESAEHSAATILAILEGKRGTPRDHALMNAGAALLVAGIAADIREGVCLASEAIDSGAARDTLERWRELTALPG